MPFAGASRVVVEVKVVGVVVFVVVVGVLADVVVGEAVVGGI